MATEQQVKQYLAYWFQLGKPIVHSKAQTQLLPYPIMQADRYSQAFQAAWQQIVASPSHYYLEGTNETIAELLSPAWEVTDCARCAMPVPVKSVGTQSLECPCVDLPGWPNTEIPQPRDPVNSQAQLSRLRDRLSQVRRASNTP
jgi:hypothetical protein